MKPSSSSPHVAHECDYEVVIKGSTAAFGRFGRAVFEHSVRVVDTAMLGERVCVALVRCLPQRVKAFARDAKPFSCTYRSPGFFDEGMTYFRLYDSPGDEVAGKKRREAVAAEAKRRKAGPLFRSGALLDDDDKRET